MTLHITIIITNCKKNKVELNYIYNDNLELWVAHLELIFFRLLLENITKFGTAKFKF